MVIENRLFYIDIERTHENIEHIGETEQGQHQAMLFSVI